MQFTDEVLFMITCSAGSKIRKHPFIKHLSSFACRMGGIELFVTFLQATRPYPGLLSEVLPANAAFCDSYQLDRPRYDTIHTIVAAAIGVQRGRVLREDDAFDPSMPSPIPRNMLNMVLSHPLSALALRFWSRL